MSWAVDVAAGAGVDWLTVITAAVGALLTGAGGTALINGLFRRKVTETEATAALTDSAIELLNTAKADARADIMALRSEVAEAKKETSAAKQEAREAYHEMAAVRQQADLLVSYLHRVLGMIHDPAMTLERLRLVVGSEPPNNSTQRRLYFREEENS